MLPGKSKTDFERLPKSVVPLNYDIIIKPDLVQLKFEGTEIITLQVNETIEKIVLNSLKLELSCASIVGTNGEENPVHQIVCDKENERATFILSSKLQPGSAKLKLSFTGVMMNDRQKGFYCSKYKNSDGEEHFSAATHFEPTNARRAFPCWDEPAMKATFDVTLIVPKDRVAISNMPVVFKSPFKPDSNLSVVKFDRTPMMSTYLVAYVVGEYEYVEERSSDEVLVRVYTLQGKKEQGRFALSVATKVLPYYKDYFGINYPLTKLDLIALPNFGFSAMENWGLVTFGEMNILQDENTPTSLLQNIAIVISHELAHQWFGNLVTMEWFTHLWLNEGYASFIECLVVDHIFPNYKIWTQFCLNKLMVALQLDSFKSSHPIEVTLSHPDEIDEIYDEISYLKGASIIRMLHNYIGDEDFRRGMNLYLTRHKYANTITEDLWAALSEASGKPIASVMSGWTKKMGYPIIHVSSHQEAGNKRVVKLKQQRFLADGSNDETNSMWMVPIEIVKSSAPTNVCHSFLLEGESDEIVLDDIKPDEWFKINPGQVGFYRTCYSADCFKELVSAIRLKTLAPLDRLGVIDDLFALVQAGQASTVEVFTLLEAFVDEDQFAVWDRICSGLEKLLQLWEYTPHYELLKNFDKQLLSRIINELGKYCKPDEDHLIKLLRSTLLSHVVKLMDPAAISKAEKRFTLLCQRKEQSPEDFHAAVDNVVAHSSNQSIYGTMIDMYRETSIEEERMRIAFALGSVQSEKLMQEVLTFSLSSEVRSRDTEYFIFALTANKAGRDLAWNFFKENFSLFNERFKGQSLIRMIEYITSYFATEEKAIEIETFFMENSCAGTERTVQQGAESIRLNAAWLKRDEAKVGDYFSANQLV